MGAHVFSGELIVGVEHFDWVESVQEDGLGSRGCVSPLHNGLVAEVAGDKMLL